MINKVKSLIKTPLLRDTILYGFGNISNAAVYIILLPLLTKTFTPGEYGLMELISVTILIIATVAGLGLDSAILRFFCGEEDIEKQRRVCSTVMTASMVSALAFVILSFFFFYLIDIGIFSQAKIPLFLALADIPFAVFIANIQAFLRISKKAIWFCLIAFLRILFTFFLTFILIRLFSFGIASLFLSILIVDGALTLITLPFLRNYFSFDFSPLTLKKTLSYSLPLILSSLIIVLLGNINKYFLQHFHGLRAVGVYAVGQKICMVLGIGGTSFRQAWIPHAFSIMQKGDSEVIYRKTFTAFILIFFTCALLLVLTAPWLIPFISSGKYAEAAVIIGYVSAGIILINLSGSFFNLGIHIKEKTKFSAVAYISGLAVNIALNLALIPYFSILGAGLALLAGYFVTAILLFYFSNRIYRISYNMKLFLIVLGSYLILVTFISAKGSW